MILQPTAANVFNFVISIGIVAFSCIFLENYYNVRDCFYTGSFTFLLFFRMVLVCGSLANLIAISFGTYINILIFYHLCASFALILAYFMSGWTIYKDNILSNGIKIFIMLYFNISFNLCLYYTTSISSTAFLVQIPISFAATSFYFHQKLLNKK
jgi:hypothetical protein